MNWEWIVPVVVLVVWILMQVIRPAEEQAQEKDARPMPPGDGTAPKPASEVDRFLEEINRMRRKAAEDQGRSPPPEPPRPRPAQIPMVEPASRRVEEVIPLGRRVEQIPTVEPVAKAPSPQSPPSQSRPRRTVPAAPPPAVPIVEMLAAAPALPSMHKKAQTTTPPGAAVNLQALLRTPGSVRTAILLHEVLGPPRSRRPVRD